MQAQTTEDFEREHGCTVDEFNARQSAEEVAAFKRDAPMRYFAYHEGGRPTGGMGRRLVTWTGDLLAQVTWTGDVYRSNFGDRRQAFRADAINGATYSGVAYLDAGDYVRMRKVKS
jgi:hypothetical protein